MPKEFKEADPGTRARATEATSMEKGKNHIRILKLSKSKKERLHRVKKKRGMGSKRLAEHHHKY